MDAVSDSKLLTTDPNKSKADAQFSPAQRMTLREIVYAELYNRILDGTLASGTRLKEGEIARQMGISRGPIREAIRQLQQDGLLVCLPGKGTFVARLSPDELSDCYLLRIALETLAIRLVMERAKPEDLDSLETYIQQMRRLDHTSKEMALCTGKFHERLCELSRNKILLKTWSTMSSQMRALALPVLNRAYTSSEHVAQRHKDIVDAIRSGEVSHAERGIAEHISEAGAKVIRFLSMRE